MCDPSSLSQDSSSKDSLQTHAEVSPLQQAGCLPFGKGAAEKQVCLYLTRSMAYICPVQLAWLYAKINHDSEQSKGSWFLYVWGKFGASAEDKVIK